MLFNEIHIRVNGIIKVFKQHPYVSEYSKAKIKDLELVTAELHSIFPSKSNLTF